VSELDHLRAVSAAAVALKPGPLADLLEVYTADDESADRADVEVAIDRLRRLADELGRTEGRARVTGRQIARGRLL
jgi:hypothetical protein